MAFCHRCGASVPVGTHACPSCGASVAVTTAPAPSSAAGRGPVGKTREPIVVILLAIFTFGIYPIFYWWNVSKEVDAHTYDAAGAHPKIRIATYLYGAGLVLSIVALVMVVGALVSIETEGDPDAVSDGAMAAMGSGMLVILLALVAVLVGAIFFFMGAWRIWSTIRDDETRRRVPSPLSPGLMLAFALIPYVNLVTMWIMYWRTTKGLNDMWASAGGATPLTSV